MRKKLMIVVFCLSLALIFCIGCAEKKDNQLPADDANEKIIYTITFDSNGGSAISSQRIEKDEKIVMPPAPKKEAGNGLEYEFKEWQLDGVKYDFSKAVTKSITLKAVYESWGPIVP